jgi:hypothetical protein
MARRAAAGGAPPPAKVGRRRHFASPGNPKGGPQEPGTALVSLGRTRQGAPLRSLTCAGLLRAVPGHEINRS